MLTSLLEAIGFRKCQFFGIMDDTYISCMRQDIAILILLFLIFVVVGGYISQMRTSE